MISYSLDPVYYSAARGVLFLFLSSDFYNFLSFESILVSLKTALFASFEV